MPSELLLTTAFSRTLTEKLPTEVACKTNVYDVLLNGVSDFLVGMEPDDTVTVICPTPMLTIGEENFTAKFIM